MNPAGKRSRGTTSFSGSGEGRGEPFREVWEYRPPRPRTKTYFPSATVTPVIRWATSAASEAEDRLISRAPTASIMAEAEARWSRRNAVLPCSRAALTVMAAISMASVSMEMSMEMVEPPSTVTPVTVFRVNPIISATRSWSPLGTLRIR